MRLTRIVDIGAAQLDEKVSYTHMLKNGHCEVLGFEPQAKQLAELREAAGPNERYLPFAVADGTRRPFYVSTNPGMSSLLELDEAAIRLFNMEATVDHRESIQTVRLDDISEARPCDFLRMDVQGAEAIILDNAPETLRSVVAIQLEVSFIPTYLGQLNYGQMDRKLRGLGFMPHKFLLSRYSFLVGTSVRHASQLLEADIVYIRDLAGPMSSEQWYHLGQLAHYVFGSEDLRQFCANRVQAMKEAA